MTTITVLLSILSDIQQYIPLLSSPILFTITCISLLAYTIYRTSAQYPTNIYKHPHHKPYFGVLLDLLGYWDRLYDANVEIIRQIGEDKTYAWSIPNFSFSHTAPMYITIGCDERLSKYILKDNMNNYAKAYDFKLIFSEFLQEGIFNVDGQKWQKQRKIASHVFTNRNISTSMTEIFNKNTDILLQRFDGYADSKTEFDIQDMFFRYTLESFAEIAFGEQPHVLNDNAESLAWAKSYDTVQMIAADRFTSTTWQLKKMLNIGNERRFRHHIRIINDYAKSVIAKRKKTYTTSDIKHSPTDILSRFIQYSIDHNEQLTDQELRDVVINFIVAGRDTTACALSWATYELTQNQEWQDKLYNAVNDIVSNSNSDNIHQAYDTCSHLPIIQAFLHETLRLHPSVPGDAKVAMNDDILPDGTHIKAGSIINYNPYSFGRSKRLWGDDCDEFKVDRWIDNTTRTGLKDISQFKFITFNAGPRLCLGKPVALHEAGLLLSQLVHRYKFNVRDGFVPQYTITITLPMKYGLPVTLQRR